MATQLTPARHQDDPAVEVSVFKLVATPGDPKLAAARNGVKRLRTVRLALVIIGGITNANSETLLSASASCAAAAPPQRAAV